MAEFPGENYVSLATFRKDGREVATPVWFAEAGDRIIVYSENTAGKVKRLRNNPRVRLAPCTFNGTVTGPWREGTGRIVEDEAGFRAGIAALRAKYGWQFRIGTWFSWLTGRIRRRTVIELCLSA
jgi:PPOX class probable F420-dependent enzyme